MSMYGYRRTTCKPQIGGAKRRRLLKLRYLIPLDELYAVAVGVPETGEAGAGHDTAGGLVEVPSAPPATVRAAENVQEVFELLRDLGQ